MEEIIIFLNEQALVLLTAITALIIFYYTRETYYLRKETQKQTSHLFTPYLVLRSIPNEGMSLKNLGKGVAKNIIFDQESSIISNEPLVNIATAGAEEERKIFRHSSDRDGYWGVDHRELPEKVSITYEDLLDNKYKVVFTKFKDFRDFLIVSQDRI